jgi:hypothetical protein
MSESREREITEAFVSLASSLASGYDVVDLLNTLTMECARLLDIAAAGLLLADRAGVLHVLAASSEHTRQLELFQLQREQGPCLDCYRSGAAVTVTNITEAAERWPAFAAGAQRAGFHSVHALPMRLRNDTLGTLGLFGTTAGALNLEDLVLGQALADVASVALFHERAATDKALINEQLQNALTSRVVIEQAKGVIAQHGQLNMADAFAVLRRYARDHNLRLTDAAQHVVDRTPTAQDLLQNVAARDSRPS